jgi:PEP-CTERM motif
MDPGEFDFHHALSTTTLVSSSDDSRKIELFEVRPEYRLWERWGWRHDFRGAPDPSTSPVSAPEPSTIRMLAIGLIGLLGSALLVSPSRPRAS